MVNKWYNEPNCDWFDEEREHRKILTKRIKSACKVAIWASAFSMFGFVGSVELGKISLTQFLVYELIAVMVLLVSVAVGVE